MNEERELDRRFRRLRRQAIDLSARLDGAGQTLPTADFAVMVRLVMALVDLLVILTTENRDLRDRLRSSRRD